MTEDLGDMRSRISFLKSFEDFVDAFTEEIEVDGERVKDLPKSLAGDSLTPIQITADTMLRHGVFEGTNVEDGAFQAFQWGAWLSQPSAIVRNVSEASGHKIVDAEWYTATVDWILVGLTQPATSIYKRNIPVIVQTACQWRTKVLYSADKDQKLAIVDFEKPRGLDLNDRAELLPLVEKATTSEMLFFLRLGAHISPFLWEHADLDINFEDIRSAPPAEGDGNPPGSG